MNTLTNVKRETTILELPQAEWSRLLDFEPFASGGLPNPEYWRIVVAIDEESRQIVGFTCLYTAVHFEPIWIDPAHRNQPNLFRGLWQVSKQILDEHGVQMIFAVVPDALPHQKALVEHVGFVPAPGQLYVVETDKVRIQE